MVMTNFRDYEEDSFEAGVLLSYGQHIHTAKRRKKLRRRGGRYWGNLVPTALTLLGTDQ